MIGTQSDKSLRRGLNAGKASAAEKLHRRYRGEVQVVKPLNEDAGHDRVE
jgi:hypothetical protein